MHTDLSQNRTRNRPVTPATHRATAVPSSRACGSDSGAGSAMSVCRSWCFFWPLVSDCSRAWCIDGSSVSPCAVSTMLCGPLVRSVNERSCEPVCDSVIVYGSGSQPVLPGAPPPASAFDDPAPDPAPWPWASPTGGVTVSAMSDEAPGTGLSYSSRSVTRSRI
jgi:hypothetical protein